MNRLQRLSQSLLQVLTCRCSHLAHNRTPVSLFKNANKTIPGCTSLQSIAFEKFSRHSHLQCYFWNMRYASSGKLLMFPSPRICAGLPLESIKYIHSSPNPIGPDAETRKHRLLTATYMSFFIGAILLSAVGFKQYKIFKKRAIGIEDVEAREFGRKNKLSSYRGFVFMSHVTNDVKGIHQFKVREDDIWVVTYPKSGTTWVQEIIYLLCNDLDFDKASKIHMDERFPYFEFFFPGKDVIHNTASPRFIKTHLPMSLLPNQMKEKKPKIIYVARNPKDVAVSFHHFMTKFFQPVNSFHGTLDDFCRLFVEDKVPYGPWWKHVQEAWAKKDEDNILFLFYEDLKMDLAKVVRQLALFLDKPVTESQVQALVNHCSFNHMKNNQTVTYDWLREQGVATLDKNISFMRKGEVGDWRNHLSIEMVQRFETMVQEKIIPLEIPIRDTLPECESQVQN